MQRLQEKYNKEIIKTLKEEFGVKNVHALPKLKKVIVNIGIGGLLKNQGQIDALKKDITAIVGQAPSMRQAKLSIASFNIRSGMAVGMAATLRGERMYSFVDKLFSIVLPRLRDFRGVSDKAFDANGNYTLGMSEHTIFPEIDISKSAAPHGMEITMVTNCGNIEMSKRLLELLGCPFVKNKK